jgi:hypothetical protein
LQTRKNENPNSLQDRQGVANIAIFLHRDLRNEGRIEDGNYPRPAAGIRKTDFKTPSRACEAALPLP